MSNPTSAILAASWLLVPLAAFAHVEDGGGGGLLSGLSHPVSGLDHVLAMVAVGIWGAQLGRPAIWLLPVVFALLMALGGFAGLVGWDLPAIEVGIALSAVVLGALILGSGCRWPLRCSSSRSSPSSTAMPTGRKWRPGRA
jgi:urease accessory protein